MNVGLESGGIWSELGNDSLLRNFFQTISLQLESNNWGSKYPYLLNKLYYDKLGASEIPDALDELKDIQQKFKQIRTNESSLTLSEYFHAKNGRNLFDIFTEVLEFCNRRKIAVKILNEEDLVK